VLGFDYKEKKAVVFIGSSRVRLDVDVKNQSLSGTGQCSDWAYGLPDPLPEALRKVAKNYTGNMSISISVKPKPDFKLKENCSFRCSQSPIKDLFDPDGFEYTAYHPDGSTFTRKTGPNHSDWIPISNIPPQLALAVTTLEDPGFQSHHGILPLAIKNSLLANLQTGKFTRGGSTITMQLAKNLWLSRDKTLLRKADEAMLVFALESCLTKEKILEFYLNIVQFGPNLYGIGPASEHYFHKMPASLTVDEAFYLAMILPRPERAPAPESGGLAQAQGLMKLLTRNGFMMEGIADE
jgi:membrane peptidoglycan carboxypeptidase